MMPCRAVPSHSFAAGATRALGAACLPSCSRLRTSCKPGTARHSDSTAQPRPVCPGALRTGMCGEADAVVGGAASRARHRAAFGSHGRAAQARELPWRRAHTVLCSGAGLSQLCAALLGQPLDKSARLTNWSRRPLTRQQSEYAGLDALVLTSIYVALVPAWQERLGSLRR